MDPYKDLRNILLVNGIDEGAMNTGFCFDTIAFSHLIRVIIEIRNFRVIISEAKPIAFYEHENKREERGSNNDMALNPKSIQ